MKLTRKRRLAISELVASLIMIAITLVAGSAVFGWINGQASVSEGAYGNSVANNVNFLNERFVVLTESFAGSAGDCATVGGSSPNYWCTTASFWIYNTGKVGFTLLSVRIQNLTNAPSGAGYSHAVNIVFYAANSAGCSTSSQSCGFIAYNQAGTAIVCSDPNSGHPGKFGVPVALQPGFYQNSAPPTVLGIGQLSSYPYQVTMPTAATCAGSLNAGAMYLYDGEPYQLTFTGLYGNTFSTIVTVSG